MPPVWVWHPKVHAHFHEKLCYFLLAVKPYDKEVFEPDLRALLDVYGVSRVCHYELLGSFDVLLRVWLVQGLRGQFERDAQSGIRNCQNVLSFEVDRPVMPWGFEKIPDPTEDAITRYITPENVRRIQESAVAADDPLLVSIKTANLLSDGEEVERKLDRPVKAFVAISAPPDFYGNVARSGKFVSQLKEYLSEVDSWALYSGIGFAWVLIKVAVQDFYAIGRLVSRLHRDHSHEGISTSTFVVSETEWRQGEAISDLALRESSGPNREVYKVLPSLYEAKLNAQDIGKFEDAVLEVRRKAQEGQISTTDENTAIRFLHAVLASDRMAAFQSLYGVLGTTEELLRADLNAAAGLVFGAPRTLIERIKVVDERDPPSSPETRSTAKSIETLTLGDVFKSWRILFAEDKEFGIRVDEFGLDFSPQRVGKIAQMRNRVMHFGEFVPRRDWEEWLQNLLALFRLTPIFQRLIPDFLDYWKMKRRAAAEMTAPIS